MPEQATPVAPASSASAAPASRDAEALVLRAALLQPKTLDLKARSVEAVLATEEPVMVYDWNRGETILEVLSMAGVELPASRQVVLLDTHSRWGVASVIGSTRELRVEGAALVGRNCYAQTPEGDQAWTLVRDGHLTDNSVGYRVLAFTDIEPGGTAKVNGRDYTAPANMALRVTTKWSLRENSNCPIGADPGAKTRAVTAPGVIAGASQPSPNQPHEGARTMPEQTPAVAAVPAVPSVPPVPVIDFRTELDKLRAELAQERAEAVRVETIRAEGARHEFPADKLAKLLTDKVSVEAARAAFLDHVQATRPRPGAPSIAPDGAAAIARDDIACALVLRSGNAALAEKHYGAKACEVAGKHLRNLTLLDATRQALQAAGHRVDGLDRDEVIRAGYSTGTLPYILGNAAHKFLLQGWGDAAQTWRKLCRVISVADFKAQELLRMQDAGDLEEVPAQGEVPYARRSEDREQLKAKTYARNFGVSRQDIINDDLGVFTEVPRLHGVRAAKRIAKLVWTHIMSNPTMNDSVAFFYATTHVNLNTSCALTADNLATAIKGFRNQTDANGDPVDVNPAFLVVPPTLEEMAKQLCFSNIILPYGGTSDTTRRPQANIWAGTLEPVVEPRLEAAAYAGYSTSTWYLFANPAELAAVVVGFLNGQENPTIERFDMGADRFGVTYRVSIDAGVRVAEYRAASRQNA